MTPTEEAANARKLAGQLQEHCTAFLNIQEVNDMRAALLRYAAMLEKPVAWQSRHGHPWYVETSEKTAALMDKPIPLFRLPTP